MELNIVKKWGFFSAIHKAFQRYKPEFIICVLGCIITCAFFKFVDGLSIQAWAVETADAFFRGGLSGFSEIMEQNLWSAPHGAFPLSGSISVNNLMYTIWNLPVLFVHYIFNTGYSISFAGRMWGKLYLVLFVIAISYIVYKIVLKITNDTNRGILAAILVCGAPSIMISVGYAMQDEVVYIFFAVMGLHETICERKNRSLIWLILTCITCPLMVLFCIPMILYSSKNIWETIWRLIVLFGSTLFEMLWLSGTNTGLAEGELSGLFSKVTFYTTFGGKFSFLALVLMFIYMMQWSSKKSGERIQDIKLLIWRLAILFAAVCTLAGMTHYRFMICIPFFAISLMVVEDNQVVRSGLFSLLVFEVVRIWGMQTKAFLRLYAFPDFLRRLFDLEEAGGGATVFSVFNLIFPNLSAHSYIFNGIALACIVWFFYICNPKWRGKVVCQISTRVMTVLWCSVQIIIVFAVSAFLLKANILNIAVGLNRDTIPIDGNNYVEEYYCGKSATKLLITVNLSSTGKGYPAGQKLNLDIIDADSEDVIATTFYDAKDISGGKEVTFRIEDIKMLDGHWYKFRFYSPEPIESEGQYMYLHIGEGTANPNRHYAVSVEDGVITIGDYDIVCQVITF